MITDAQFQQWLLRGGLRTLLVEAKAYSGGVEVTRYFSNRAFISEPGDTPANTAYDDILISQSVKFSRALPDIMSGRTAVSWGDLQVTNENGERDSWLDDSWDGRSLRLYLGDASWQKSDFRLILDGVCADIYSPQRARLAFRIRDKSWMLNVAAQTTLIGGTGPHKDQPMPICLGKVFNGKAMLIDAATHTYAVHEGPVQAITAVREGGNATAYVADLPNGRFSLTGAPTGEITFDAQGGKLDGVYVDQAADLFRYMVLNHSQLVADDLNAVSFAAFNAACSQELGLYIGERQNLLDVLDAIIASPGGFWSLDTDGQIRLGRWIAPSGTPVIQLTADDVRPRMLSVRRRELPIATYRLGYKRNWTVQTEGLVGAVTEANRAAYGTEYLVAKGENAGLTTSFKLARSPDLVPSLLVDAAEADTEADRRQALHDVPRSTYALGAYMAPFNLNLGEIVELDHPRFGFAGGELAMVAAIEGEILKGRAALDLWR
jgi:hypothetical protein